MVMPPLPLQATRVKYSLTLCAVQTCTYYSTRRRLPRGRLLSRLPRGPHPCLPPVNSVTQSPRSMYIHSQALLCSVNECLISPLPTTAMRAVLLRTGSVPVLPSALPRLSFGVHDSVAGSFSGDWTGLSSPRISLHFRNHLPREVSSRRIRRALSESDIIRSGSGISALNGVGSRSSPARIAEEEDDADEDDEGRPLVVQQTSADRVNYAVSWPEIGIPVEELGFSGGGADGDDGGSFTGGGNGDRQKLAAYYEEMLKLNPGDALLLRNYAKFLHEVEKDSRKAEEYYGRAILASPGDGEVLSLFAQLIWETERDHDRAKYYFDQAVSASPNDCMVMGSYAQFMWETEEEEEEEEENEAMKMEGITMVEAF